MKASQNEHEVVIIGGGVVGTALLYVLSNYTNVSKIALIEKNDKVAQVNSHNNNNSQTLHFGDIETNYTLEKAKKVKEAAILVEKYLLKNDSKKEIYTKYHKMVLAVGANEVKDLNERYKEFKFLFPKLKKIGKKEVKELEPGVIEGRDENEKVSALFSENGYSVDFGRLSESFVKNATKNKKKNIRVFMGKKVDTIKKVDKGFKLKIGEKEIFSKVIVVAAGAHSLNFAKEMGCGKNFALLIISGNFYLANKLVNGKIYTMQMKKLPFAAIHADPEAHDANITRFGPTAKMLFMLERHNYGTVWEFLKTTCFNISCWQSYYSIISDYDRFKYMFKNNILFEIPFYGKVLFTKQARKIIPKIKSKDLRKARGYGGVRPQIVDLEKKQLLLGEAKIIDKNIIFNMTPSPGASTCLSNAKSDVEKIVEFLGEKYKFDKRKFKKDLSE